MQSRLGHTAFIVTKFFWVEPVILLLLAPLLLFPGRFVSLVWHPYWVVFSFLWAIFAQFFYQRRWLSTPLDGSIAVLLLWLPVNYWASIDKAQSWEMIGYLLFGAVSWRTFIQWPRLRQGPQRFIYLFVLVGAGLTLLGPLFLMADPSFTMLFPPLQIPAVAQVAVSLAETINPNVLAGALVLLLPLYVAFILQNHLVPHRALRITLVILWLLMVGVLFITQSRGALLAAALAILIVVRLCYSKTAWLMPVLIILLISTALWMGPRHLLEALVTSSAFGGIDGRIEIWNRALYAFHDFPFTGIGIGTFQKVIPLLYPYFLWMPEQEIPHAHNLFLQIGIDLGLIGLIAQISIWINLFRMLLSLLHRQQSAERVIAAGAFGSLIGMLIHGFVDAVTWGNKLAFLPWWLYALITLLFLQHGQEVRDAASQARCSKSIVSIS